MRTVALCFVLFLSFVCAALADELNFLIMGDWGGSPDASANYTTPGEEAVATAMAAALQKQGSKFVLALGDNFYDSGVTSVTSNRFLYTYENHFTTDKFPVPFYVIAGNHDHRGNVEAEIEYSSKDSRWHFPDYYFSFNYTVGSSKILFIMLDTVKLCDFPGDPTQLEWLKKTLEGASEYDLILAHGHYPVWSIAEHGPTSAMVKYIKPLFEQYKVAAYTCGHEHAMEHLQQNDVDYFVSGAAHSLDDSTAHSNDVPAGSLKFHWPTSYGSALSAFSTFQFNGQSWILTMWDNEGNQLYTYTRKVESRAGLQLSEPMRAALPSVEAYVLDSRSFPATTFD